MRFAASVLAIFLVVAGSFCAGAPSERSGYHLQTWLRKQLADVNQELGDVPDEEHESSVVPGELVKGNLSIVIGTSQLAAEHPGLVERLVSMINKAYHDSLIDIPDRAASHKSVTAADVTERLAMGDVGSRANRVLHVALQGGDAIGCVSSTFTTPWTPPDCGQWGLLAVDVAAQGLGLGSKLVKAAESRLAGVCNQIQIEYTYSKDHAYSDRLKGWYEGKLNFSLHESYNQSDRDEFRIVRKVVPSLAARQGRRQRLLHVRKELTSKLIKNVRAGVAVAPADREDGVCQADIDRINAALLADGATYVNMSGAVFQFVLYDAGPKCNFVLDLKSSGGKVWIGEESNVACSLELTAMDLAHWLDGALDGNLAFMSGRLKLAGGFGCIAVAKLNSVFKAVREAKDHARPNPDGKLGDEL